MASLTRVAWEGRDSAVRLRETVPLDEAKLADAPPEHQPTEVITITNDIGRPMTLISRYCPKTFGDTDEEVVQPTPTPADNKVTDEELHETDSRRSVASEMMEPEPPSEAEVGVVPARYYERYFQEHTFSMNDHGLGGSGAQALSGCLCDNFHITTLEIAGNGIGGRGMKHVASMLSHNRNITKINLSNNKLRSEGIAVAAEHFASGRSILHEVDLSSNGFLDMDARDVCEALQSCTDLRVLSFANNEFGDMSAKHFGALISNSTTLLDLDLSGNCIRPKGAQHIAAGIAGNIAMTRLNLDHNGLGTAGMKAIAEALGSNTTLTTLHVAGNNIGNDAAEALAAALKSRKGMVRVDVSHNPISGPGIRALFEAVGACGEPCALAFDGIVLDDKSIEALREAMTLNPSATFHGDFPTFAGFDDVREEAMVAASRLAKREHVRKEREDTTACNSGGKRSGGTFVEERTDGSGPSGLPAHLSRSTKGNMWDGVDQKDLRGRGVGRSSMMIDPKELAAFDEDDPQAERMRMWALNHPDLADPMLALERYVFMNRLRLVDFFFSIDKDRSGGVTWDEFAQAVEVLDGLDLSHEQMEELYERLDIDDDGELNYEEMCEGRREVTEKLRARDPRWTTRQEESSESESSDDED